MTKRGIEMRIFHAIWWTLAMLLPDLLGFALRDWRAAVAGAAASAIMIVLSVRVFMRGEMTNVDAYFEPTLPAKDRVAQGVSG